MKTLIIEDEHVLANRLKDQLLHLRPEMEIFGPIGTITEARDIILQRPDLDLILSDIRLEDGNCFEIFDSTPTQSMIVFTTAFDDYALKAFDYNCVDYLLKPISSDKLENALRRCESRIAGTNSSRIQEMIGDILHHQVNYRKRLMLDRGDELLVCDVQDICFIETESGYTRVYMKDNSWGSTALPLLELSDSLPEDTFFRLNRQVIVNISSVRALSQGIGRETIVTLKPPFQERIFKISPNRRKSLITLLDQ